MYGPLWETSPSLVFHGGGLDAARERFPAAPPPWVDLSTGINARPYPVGTLPEAAWHRLPDKAGLERLEIAAARAYGAGEADGVVATPGTQAVIQWLPQLLTGRRVAVLGFGYEEHPATWRAAGAEVAVVDSLDALASADVAVVINPNNPDGRLVHPERLLSVSHRLAARGGTLVVDEAFMDVMDPGLSLVPRLPTAGVVVLRSFGKAFGLAGLRLGFAVTNPPLASRLRAALGPWAVSGPAIAVATEALADRAWQKASLERLEADASRLDDVLSRAGFEILGGTPLFRLAAHARAADWFDRFGRAGILVRPFPARATWLRFGVPGEAFHWTRLSQALEP